MNSYSSQIEGNDFFKELFNDIQPILEKLHQDKDYALSDSERYSASVFKWAGRIRDCFETLEHARVHLGHFRTSKWYKKAGIGRSQHINYHYYNYAISAVRTIDVALILTNATSQLGNPEKLCRLEHVIQNSWVRSTSVAKALKKINAIVKSWREPKNLFVHRGETLDISGQRQDSDLLFLLEAHDLFSEQDKSIADVPLTRINSWYKSVVSGIFQEFDKTEKPLFDATNELLTSLLPTYRSWRNALTKTSSAS